MIPAAISRNMISITPKAPEPIVFKLLESKPEIKIALKVGNPIDIKLQKQRTTIKRSSHGAGWLTTGRGKVIVRILQKRFTKTQLNSALDL